jgi:hypothetical protein
MGVSSVWARYQVWARYHRIHPPSGDGSNGSGMCLLLWEATQGSYALAVASRR